MEFCLPGRLEWWGSHANALIVTLPIPKQKQNKHLILTYAKYKGLVSREEYCWQMSSRKRNKLLYSFPSINMSGHILNRFATKQTNTVDRISISFFLLQWLSFGYSSRVYCFVVFVHFWFCRPAFHHPSHYEYKIIPSAPWQRASFFFFWGMQLYQYLPNSGTVNASISDDKWDCCNIAEMWITLSQWEHVFSTYSAGSNADNLGQTLRLKTNPDWSLFFHLLGSKVYMYTFCISQFLFC